MYASVLNMFFCVELYRYEAVIANYFAMTIMA